jgi:sugar phosphate isomerase/epimerase
MMPWGRPADKGVHPIPEPARDFHPIGPPPARRPVTDRPLGTMVAYGFPRVAIEADLALALRLGARCLEILPLWSELPDPRAVALRASDLGLTIHSAHGCWGGQSIRAFRIDLASLDPKERLSSLDDLRLCLDWLRDAGGSCLVVHPGGFSQPEDSRARRGALAESLLTLADHARGTGVAVCVENMPPGVHPGSRMADLAGLLLELDRPELALALDTGHANLMASAASETLAAGRLLRTTHVHDNNGRQDSHDPPGLGTVAWDDWANALDSVGYSGPVMLECIRHIRDRPECLDDALSERLARLTRRHPGPGEETAEVSASP